MKISRLLYRLGWALGVSIVALGIAVVVQGIILFRQPFQSLRDPDQTTIRQFSIVAGGQRAIALLRLAPHVPSHKYRYTLQSCELAENSAALQQFDLGFTPWSVATARHAEHVFVSSTAGDLYCCDATAPASQPRLLGRHADCPPVLLECAGDGSVVIIGTVRSTSAWSTASATCLWQRSDIFIESARFQVPSSRLFCKLHGGPCVELDRSTGSTLQSFDGPREQALSLDVSLDDRYLATLGRHGEYAVTDLESGQELWVKHYPQPGVPPRFSPDGQCVLVPARGRYRAVHVLSTTTGELLAELRGVKAEIVGIEVTSSGIVYACDIFGALTAWDLVTRTLLRQYNLTCSPANARSI